MPRRTHRDPTIGERIKTRRELRGWSLRFAADRAGIAHTTWSRIEQGVISADNRFTLMDIATALECPVSDLAGHPAASVDPAIAGADAQVPGIFNALMEVAADEPSDRPAKPAAQLMRDLDLVRDLYRRCDHAGIVRLLPDLLLDVHAASTGGESRIVLGYAVQLHLITMATLKHMGRPAEAWIAAERGREAAIRLESPVAVAVAEFGRTCAATAADGYKRSYSLAQRGIEALTPHLEEEHALEALGLLTLRVGFAACGMRRQNEATEALDEAQRIAQRTGETNLWDMYFGPSNVATWRMGIEVDAGDPGRAVEIAGTVNPGTFGAPVRQSVFYLDTARALTRMRRNQEAERTLLIAERMAPQRVRRMPLAFETARHLLQHGRPSTQLRGLCERLGVPL